jgi:hypothetical protein
MSEWIHLLEGGAPLDRRELTVSPSAYLGPTIATHRCSWGTPMRAALAASPPPDAGLGRDARPFMCCHSKRQRRSSSERWAPKKSPPREGPWRCQDCRNGELRNALTLISTGRPQGSRSYSVAISGVYAPPTVPFCSVRLVCWRFCWQTNLCPVSHHRAQQFLHCTRRRRTGRQGSCRFARDEDVRSEICRLHRPIG